jgi:DDE superfamily endonuclease
LYKWREFIAAKHPDHTFQTGSKKSTKKKPLTKEEKEQNRKISSERVVNENVIGSLKRFKIINDRYRNRRKRFGLRFNLIAGIHNMELNQ